MHAKTVSDGDAFVIVRSAAPLGANHTPSNESPLEQSRDGSGDQSSPFGFGFEPAADLADTPRRVEGDEHDSADQVLVVPGSVEASTIRSAGVRVPAEGGACAINRVRDERRPDPRSNVLLCPGKTSRKLNSVPNLKGPKVTTIGYHFREHITPLVCTGLDTGQTARCFGVNAPIRTGALTPKLCSDTWPSYSESAVIPAVDSMTSFSFLANAS